MHNAFVRINKEKMSKSLGNFFTLRDIFEQFNPMVIRFYFLKHHYKAPIDFVIDDIKATETAYKRLVRSFDNIDASSIDSKDLMANKWIKQIVDYLMDDLNTSGAFGVIFEALSSDITYQERSELKKCVIDLFGITLEPLSEKKVEITPEIQQMIDEREQARKDKNWSKADELRDKLTALGVQLHDSKAIKERPQKTLVGGIPLQAQQGFGFTTLPAFLYVIIISKINIAHQ